MLSTIALAACFSLTANAFVNYGDAVLYDEFDLSTYKSFPLPECLAASCKVYVSAPNSSLATLEKIYLGDTTLAALARQSDPATGLKTPYSLKAYSGKNFITNLNWKFASAPVAVYVVYQRAAFFSSALVYEPSSASSLVVNWRNASTLTFISTTNFTVKGAVKDGHLFGGRVVATGFDLAKRNWARIPALYEFTDDKAFEFSFNSPLVSFYAPLSVDVDVTVESGFKEIASSRSFLTSPGFAGLASTQVYLSSLYNKTVQYRITYEKKTTVHFHAFLNTFVDSIEVTADGKETITLHATPYGTRQLFSIQGQDLLIRFTKATPLSAFLLYIRADVEQPATPSESPAVNTTDSPAAPSESSVTGGVTDGPTVSVQPSVTDATVIETVKTPAPKAPVSVTEGLQDATPAPAKQDTEAPVAPVVTIEPETTEQPSESDSDVSIVEFEDIRRVRPVHPVA